MNSLALDCVTAFRFFARRRAATVVIVLTMALAIGANTAVFSVLKAFVFANLAVPESDRVVFVWTVRQLEGRGAVNFLDAHINYHLIRDTTRFWESISTTLGVDLNWQADDGESRRLQGVRATADFFKVVRVQPTLGRVFTAKEEGPRAAPVAVISDAFWRREFQGAHDVLGKMVRLNGTPHTIIGVLPPRFTQPQGTDVWLPFDLPDNMWNAIIGGRQLTTYARLAPGVSVDAANEELKQFTPRAIEMDGQNKDWTWAVQPMREALLANADRTLVFVQCGAAVLLLLAITNLASLLLAWASERERETAVRLALGARAWRLVRQFLTQSVLLVSLGGAAGVLLAAAALPALERFNPNRALAAFLTDLRIDGSTLLFAAALVAITGMLAGLLPALQAGRTGLNEALRAESRGSSVGRDGLRWQKLMVVLQAAISVVILVGAAQAAAGFSRLNRVDLGFRTDNRAVLQVQFPEPSHASHEARAEFARRLEQNLANEPVLQSFGFTSSLPVGDTQWGGGFHPQRPDGGFTQEPQVFHFRRVSPGFIGAMGIPLIEGRLLNERDRQDSPPVAVISKALAEKYWPGQSAIGRQLKRAMPKDAPPVEIVGVVGNVRDAGAGFPAAETVYVPFDQLSLRRGWMVLHGENRADLLAAGRRALKATAREIAAYNPGFLDEFAWQANALPRLQMALLGVFAIIAIGITALGSYGVMSQLVANRQKEMAIRAALGSSPREVLRTVSLTNARMAGVGILIGLVGAWLAGQGATKLLPGFATSGAWPFVAVALLVLTLTQLASYLPARRAAQVDILKALS